ncbi:general secretion pathway protein GspK [Maricaulis sp.]|uniref:general secretion pathway protein GspK n=1 Tax=Maricaulis sp. TaxID=1486257 RepID=UPI003A9482F4
MSIARPHNRQAGSAIIFVLWMSVLLAVILAGAMAMTQTELRLGAGRRTMLAERETLLSALDLVAFDTALVGRSYIASLPRTVTVSGTPVRVSLAPAQTRLDINMANDEAWMALFTGLGEPEITAQRLTDQILDWRDNDELARARGAERDDYPPGSRKRPENRPFVSVAELVQVLDMTPQRLACLAPYLTVFGGTPEGEIELTAEDVASSMDGVRVAFQADIVRPDGGASSLAALALFGANRNRPFDWVAFPVEMYNPGGCSTTAPAGGQPA